MRTLFLLWRLYRALAAAKADLRAASINVIVEPNGRYEQRVASHSFDGYGPPKRESAWEVSWWPDSQAMAQGCQTKRGRTLAEALRRALKA